MVRITDCETEGVGSIPDWIAKVFALITNYQLKNHKRFFAGTFYGSSKKVPPGTCSRGVYLEPLKDPVERWAEEPFQILLRTFFSASVSL